VKWCRKFGNRPRIEKRRGESDQTGKESSDLVNTIEKAKVRAGEGRD